MLNPLVMSSSLLILIATITLAGLPATAQEWPGAKWNDKLGPSYEPWKSTKEVLTELAQRAGVTDLSFTPEPQSSWLVPLPATATLKEALKSVAAASGYEVLWEKDKLVFRAAKSGRISWLDVLPLESHAVTVEGGSGSVFLPRKKQGSGPTPWVWYAPAQGLEQFNAWIMKRLLDEGIAVVMVNVGESAGNPKGRATFTAFYQKIVPEFKLAHKAVLWPQSRGGLQLYNWAAEHPEAVQAIGGIYTVCNPVSYPGLAEAAKAYGMTPQEFEKKLPQNNPLDRLAPLAKAHIPLFNIHGDADTVVPLDKNAGELVKRYKALGGDAQLVIVPGKGHAALPEFFRNKEIADFLVNQAKASVGGAAKHGETK
jgi:pimeloyl-ACP methyl ester carboxylesterase